MAWAALAVAMPTQAQQSTEAQLQQRIQVLESRLRQLEARQGGTTQPAPAAPNQDRLQQILDRLDALDQRMNEIESSAVLSEPETRVKKVQVWIDKNGNEHDEPVAGSTPSTTYQRERVYRRQTINEKIDEALSGNDEKKVAIGVNASSITQFAVQTGGDDSTADGNAYQLASADLFFAAKLAQYTDFYADVVGLSGSPPDSEIPSLTLLNSYTARLVRQNELNLREAWIRTELFDQRLALSFGRLDLTNYIDHNAAANDETTQFISDALVNNPLLGLASNGTGIAAVYDAKTGFTFKLGLQQSDDNATNLSDSLFTLAEVGYLARPFSLPEGNYRLWYRRDNSSGPHQDAFGVSIDQKLNAGTTLFARYGSADAPLTGKDHFYGTGVEFEYGPVLNPLDAWGVGYAFTDLATDEQEDLAELYYNFHLAEKLRLSLHLQYVMEQRPGLRDLSFLVPGLRLQASF
jgi:hypothetical protein